MHHREYCIQRTVFARNLHELLMTLPTLVLQDKETCYLTMVGKLINGTRTRVVYYRYSGMLRSKSGGTSPLKLCGGHVPLSPMICAHDQSPHQSPQVYVFINHTTHRELPSVHMVATQGSKVASPRGHAAVSPLATVET